MQAQSPAGDVKAMTFDAVSIKPSSPNALSSGMGFDHGRFSAPAAIFKFLVMFAYDMKMPDYIYGIPDAFSNARFDIEAKVDAETMEALNKLAPKEALEQEKLIVRAMLEDRFKLKAHKETKNLPIYSLVVAKGGSKMKESNLEGPDDAPKQPSLRIRSDSFTAQGITMDLFATNLTFRVNRIVVNNTGLKGHYDLALEWQPENAPASTQNNGLDAKPSIFTAMQEQLGLKLEPAKGPVETVVVDHVEMPSEN